MNIKIAAGLVSGILDRLELGFISADDASHQIVGVRKTFAACGADATALDALRIWSFADLSYSPNVTDIRSAITALL